MALAIFDLSEPYRRVSIQGTVTRVTDEGADEHYARLTQKYRGISAEEYRAQQGRPDRPPAEHRTIVRIMPGRVISRVSD